MPKPRPADNQPCDCPSCTARDADVPLVTRLRLLAGTLLEVQSAMQCGEGVMIGDLLNVIEHTMHEAADELEAAEGEPGCFGSALHGGQKWDPLAKIRRQGGVG